MKVTNFKDWKFRDPPNYAALPIDKNPKYKTHRAVNNAVFSKVPTEGLTGTLHLVCASDDVLSDILDLDPIVAETDEFINFVAGKYLPPGGFSVSHRYGGYRFEYGLDQLGDGRAHILGEYVNSKGESWQLQLKGSGKTPYSKFGDGRAGLRSSIREMVASEACHYLRVPTTRAAALVVSDDHKVHRGQRCAIVARLSPAWYRPGSVEILKIRKEPDTMRTLIDFIIKHHFPSIDATDEDRYVKWFNEVAHKNLDMVATWQVKCSIYNIQGTFPPCGIAVGQPHHFPSIDATDEDRYVKWFNEVAHKNLDMVATWQGVGFTHGGVTTDNLSVLGLTLDYGPYGFVEHYSPFYVPNGSDNMGRYAFSQQPSIMVWNMGQLAKDMQLVLTKEQILKINTIRDTLGEYVEKKVLKTHLLKLGLEQIQDGDQYLVFELFRAMHYARADFTATFRQLAELDPNQLLDKSALESKWALAKISEAANWETFVQSYQQRLEKENVNEETRRDRMNNVNPVYVPRNWILKEAITDAENNDFEKVRFLMKLFRTPYIVNEEAERRGYSAPPVPAPDPWLLILSAASSDQVVNSADGAVKPPLKAGTDNSTCPPKCATSSRNWMLQEAITDAEMDDFTKVRFLMEVLNNPYQVHPEAEKLRFSAQPPQWAYALKISCST